MITLSLVTPLGVIIGMVITEYVDSQSATQIFVIGILQGLAGGTLLYITFYEDFKLVIHNMHTNLLN